MRFSLPAGPGSIGQIFNLATIYLEWRDIGRMIIDPPLHPRPLKSSRPGSARGAILGDAWELSTAKAEKLFAYRPLFSPSIARQRLEKAIEQCRQEMRRCTARITWCSNWSDTPPG